MRFGRRCIVSELLKKKRHIFFGVRDYVVVALCTCLMAFSYYILIAPNQFAPAGILGVATILHKLFDFPVSTVTMVANIPLLVASFLLINRQFSLKSLAATAVYVVSLAVFEKLPLDRFVYYTANGTSTILAPLAGGVISGFCYGVVLRCNACTGGTDLVGALIHRFKPEYNMLWIIFSINAAVAAVSYFVYDYQIEPVILCLLYCFTSSKVGDTIIRGVKEAVKFEIITDKPEELSAALMRELDRGVTKLSAVGGFTEKDKTLLICVIGKHQIIKLQNILQRYPGTFAYLTSVKETVGNFRNS